MTSLVQPEGELFGRRLREVRLQRAVTQQWLSETAGMSEAYISNLERGFKVPSLTTIIRLAVALDCKVMDLVGAFDKTNLRALLPK
ncbi:MAG TPA: helix-turn-helix transcriptional regulator [Thermoanaerobaculia bacterium]|jgi:transcriptional regulator with XRE-family HTH domain|nr:helix-turn-helix transcriptional regulator [Thermoanaerobaculia bacterium]